MFRKRYTATKIIYEKNINTFMKILICGDRNWTNEQTIIDHLFPFVMDRPTIIHGNAKGADTIGGAVAESYGLKVIRKRADWAKHKKSAGPIRNRELLKMKPDLVLAFHNDIENSKGTKDMITIAKKAGIEVRVIKHWWNEIESDIK